MTYATEDESYWGASENSQTGKAHAAQGSQSNRGQDSWDRNSPLILGIKIPVLSDDLHCQTEQVTDDS